VGSGSDAEAILQGLQTAKTAKYPKIEISELFIDPAKPLTDAEDEYVELFNPNKTAVALEGYVIQTGLKLNYRFTLPNVSLEPGQYLALFAIDSGLTLSNSAGQARVLDPNGGVVFTTPPYDDADSNESWANINGVWRWSDIPTPNEPNQAGTPASSTDEAANPNAAAPTDDTESFVLSSGKTITTDGSQRSSFEEPETAQSKQLDMAVVAGVGGMALLYAGHEYRYDISHQLERLKRYRAARRANRG
jgi:hypothetical protein